MGRAATVDYPTPDFGLDYTVAHNGSRTAGEYPGFDRFGRVIRQVWADGNLTTHATDTTVPNIPPIYEEEHSYDNAGNRLKSFDVRPGASWDDRHWGYTYDGLDRLTEAKVGTDPFGSWSAAPASERYTYDMMDNRELLEVDFNGNGNYADTDEMYDAAFNENNEQTGQEWESVDDPTPGDPPPTDNDHLADGALSDYAQAEKTGETLPDVKYVRDAWGRLVQVKYDTNVRAEYEYNGLGHRTLAEVDTDTAPDGTVDELRLFFYDPQWRLLEERINDDSDAGSTIDRHAQQVWGFRYIDDAVMRREDGTANGSYANASDSEWYYATDVLFSVIAVLDDTANLQERVEYTPYGTALHHWSGDFDGDRDIDSGDSTALSNASGNSIDDSGYEVEIDLNRDGTIDLNDTPAAPPGGGAALPRGWASDPDSVDSMLARSSMLLDRRVELQVARNRLYNPDTARWIRPDPLRFIDGSNPFAYLRSAPTTLVDPYGTQAEPCITMACKTPAPSGQSEECCSAAGSKCGPDGSGFAGFAACCGNNYISCVFWPRYSGQPPEDEVIPQPGDEFIAECLHQHEQEHVDTAPADICANCPPGQACLPDWPEAGSPEQSARECDAWTLEAHCNFGSVSRCMDKYSGNSTQLGTCLRRVFEKTCRTCLGANLWCEDVPGKGLVPECVDFFRANALWCPPEVH